MLHVIPSVALIHGGPSRAVRWMETSLRELGLKVYTLTTDDDGPGRRFVAASAADAERHYARKWINFYKIAPGMVFWLLRHIRDYDVLHIHALFSFSSVIAAWLARLHGIPYVVRPFGTLAVYGMTARRPWLKRASLWLLEGPILRHAAAVHFTSPVEWREAAALGLTLRGTVIPLGIPVPPPPSSNSAPSSSLLFLSRVNPVKNLEALLMALQILAAQNLRPRLTVAGSGRPEYVESLHRLAASLGVADQVHWAGEVDGEEKAVLFATSQVFLLPSFSENFGIAAAEALAAGLPCVLGVGVAIAADAVAAGAAIAVEPDAESVAAAIRELLASPVRCAEMSVNARELAKHNFSTRVMASRLSALYDRVINV